MKQWFNKYKGAILKIFILVLIIVAISFLTALVLYLIGVINFDDGIAFNIEIFKSFSTSWYGAIIFILYLALLRMLLCVIPSMSMALTLLCTGVYGFTFSSFIISFASIIISSTILYVIGRFGGYRLTAKFLGESDADKALGLLRNRGTIYFPLMMLFPIFPDEALIMIAGTMKMSLKWFIPSILFGSGIGTATVVFGISIVPFEEFTSIYDWLVFLTVCAFWIIMVFTLAHKFNKKMELRHQKQIEEDTANEEVY